MITRNERAMVIELAKAISQLNSALRIVAPKLKDEERNAFEEHLNKSFEGIQEIIKLVDAEWLST